MEEAKADTCAVPDAERARLARGRYALTADGKEATFLPRSNVTAVQMQTAAFRWPDGEDIHTDTSAHQPPSTGGASARLPAALW